jgi:hypothetical protein
MRQREEFGRHGVCREAAAFGDICEAMKVA